MGYWLSDVDGAAVACWDAAAAVAVAAAGVDVDDVLYVAGCAVAGVSDDVVVGIACDRIRDAAAAGCCCRCRACVADV